MKYRLLKAINAEYNKIEIATRLNSIDLSRLKVTALDNIKKRLKILTLVILSLKPNNVWFKLNFYHKTTKIFIIRHTK